MRLFKVIRGQTFRKRSEYEKLKLNGLHGDKLWISQSSYKICDLKTNSRFGPIETVTSEFMKKIFKMAMSIISAKSVLALGSTCKLRTTYFRLCNTAVTAFQKTRNQQFQDWF